ncbi:hypothetical protein GC176_16395 [bacterium]|nr:hypothetical protein [bacterium]
MPQKYSRIQLWPRGRWSAGICRLICCLKKNAEVCWDGKTKWERVLLAILLSVVLANFPGSMAVVAQDELATSEPQSLPDNLWTDPIDGLQFRLRIDKEVWQSWELPFFWLDVRNMTNRSLTGEQLRSLLPFNRHGNHLQIVQKPGEIVSGGDTGGVRLTSFELDSLYLQPGDAFEIGQPGLRDLAGGGEISARLDLKSLGIHQRGSGLEPDTATLSLCFRGPTGPEFLGSPIRVVVLPPGVRAIQEMDDFLTAYDSKGVSVEAGFVPEATRLVDGEELRATFIVRVVGNQAFSYDFGGDYRGSNRHNRFKIDVHDSDGKLLPDPAEGRPDFGGLGTGIRVYPGRLSAQPIDLTKYRTFPGPGQYIVTARFTLENIFMMGGRRISIPVESKFRLTILSRTEENVGAALERWFARCRKTTGEDLNATIDRLCAFGGASAVTGLHDLVLTGSDERKLAAVRGLGLIAAPQSLRVLLELETQPELRITALQSLGAFSDNAAVERVAAALQDRELDVRVAAAGALGRMNSGAAVRALLDRVRERPIDIGPGTGSTDAIVAEQQALLAALGATGAASALPVIRSALDAVDDRVRRAGVAAIIQSSNAEASAVLPEYAEDDDLDFREFVIRQLTETLRQPIEPQWLVPVIQSRNGKSTIGDAPWLLRLYADDLAAPTLVSCLDFDNPRIRSYYNLVIIQQQLACRSGLAIDWISDLNRDGTPEEIAKNCDTLARLRSWVEHYAKQPWREPPEPWRLTGPREAATWGPAIGNVRIRARTNNSVWPEGLPQVLNVDVSNPMSGSVVMDSHPAIVEVEVDGEWYTHDSDVDDRVRGEWHAYKGHRYHSYQLTPHWQRVSDGEPLILKPGPHTARTRLTVPPETSRASLATSLPVKFRVASSAKTSDRESR